MLSRTDEDALRRQLQPLDHLEDGRHAQRTVHGCVLQDELRFRQFFEDTSPGFETLLVDLHKVLEHSEGDGRIGRAVRYCTRAHSRIRREVERMRQTEQLLAVELLHPLR